MITQSKASFGSESKRSGSISRFYAEDIKKKPVNLLDSFGRSCQKPKISQISDDKENASIKISQEDSFRMDRELNSIIKRVNTAINRSPCRSNKNKASISPETRQASTSVVRHDGHYESTFSFSEGIDASKQACIDRQSTGGHVLHSRHADSQTDKKRTALGVVETNAKSQSIAKLEHSYNPSYIDLTRNATRDMERNDVAKSPALMRHTATEMNQNMAKIDVFGQLKEKIEKEMTAPRKQVSSKGSTSDSIGKETSQALFNCQQSSYWVNQHDNTSLDSAVDQFHMNKNSTLSLRGRDSQVQNNTQQEIKFEELCARLKFIARKKFDSLKVLMSLIQESILYNNEARNLIARMGTSANTAVENLEKALSNGSIMMQQSDCDSPSEDLVVQALIQTVQNRAQNLLHNLKSSSSISTICSEQSSLDLYRVGTPPKSSSRMSSISRTVTEDNFFEKNNLSLKKSRQQPKRSSTKHRPAFRDIDRLQDSPQRSERSFVKSEEQNFGFKINSLASYNRRVLLGFEDGAITEIIFDRLHGIKLERCMRFRSDPVTEMLVMESGSVMASQTLVAASGMTNPTLLVINLLSGNQLLELTGHSQFVSRLLKLTDNCFASCSFDRSLRIWDIKDGSCTFNKTIHDAPLITASYSSSMGLIATGDLSGCIVLSSVSLYTGGSFKSCEQYLKFQGAGPILEIFFDFHQKIVTLEGSKLRVYDCRGTVFKDLKSPHFVSSAYFIDASTILLTDISGKPFLIDYDQALLDSSLTRPLTNDRDSDDVELASLMLSSRVTGSLPRAQFLRMTDGSQQVYSAKTTCRSLLLHILN